MKRLSRLTALLLAIMLSLSMIPAALAEEVMTMADYEESRESMLKLYESLLACEEPAAVIEAFGTMTEEEAQTFMNSLSEEQQANLIAKFEGINASITKEELLALAIALGKNTEGLYYTPAKNYTAVAGLANDPVNVAPAMYRMATFGLQRDMQPGNGLEMSKKAVATENGYKITLEAYTTGEVSNSTVAVPTDIVLVLDESGSMKDSMYQYEEVYELDQSKDYYVKENDTYIRVRWCNGGLVTSCSGWWTGLHFFRHWGTQYQPMTSPSDTASGHVQFYTRDETSTTKLEALKAAATTFVNNVYDNAVANNVDHRIAVVGFSNKGDSTIKIGLEDDIRNNIGTADTNGVLNKVNNTGANGGTYIEDGLANAKRVFEEAAETNATTRNRVVVVFTDGIPGSGSWGSETISGSANPAIETSHTLKNTYKATVYTIGLLDDADPSLEISDKTDDAARTNKFLHYLSSNYPNATSMDNGGSGSNKGYYLAASDAASLEAIFEKISQEIAVPSIDLESTTEIKDIVSPYFDMPANTSDVTVTTYDCTGYVDGSPAWASTGTALSNAVEFPAGEDSTIKVTGFDFNANFVSDTARKETSSSESANFYGRKIVIEFTVTVKGGFLGGNGVPTNGEDSGIYVGGSVVENFEVPTVDVPVKPLVVTAAEKNVYLLDAPTEAELLVGATVKAVDAYGNEYDINSLADWQKEFVVIGDPTATVDKETTMPMVEDGQYRVSASINVGTDDSTKKTTTSVPAKINVFKPVLKFQDTTVDYMSTVANPGDFDAKNYVVSESSADTTPVLTEYPQWVHNGTLAASAEMIGEEPALKPTYIPDAGINSGVVVSTTDVAVDVTVSIVTGKDESAGVSTYKDVTDHVTFIRAACKHEGCSNSGGSTHPGSAEGVPEFVLHVINVVGNLTITKRGLDVNTYAPVEGKYSDNESAIFTVTGDYDGDGDLDTFTVVIPCPEGSGSVTLTGLRVGVYRVTEQTGWTWRYGTSTITDSYVVDDVSTASDGVVKVEGNQTATVTCENSNHTDKWLGGDNYETNVFGQSN